MDVEAAKANERRSLIGHDVKRLSAAMQAQELGVKKLLFLALRLYTK
jgi:hypothetical protein